MRVYTQSQLALNIQYTRFIPLAMHACTHVEEFFAECVYYMNITEQPAKKSLYAINNKKK